MNYKTLYKILKNLVQWSHYYNNEDKLLEDVTVYINGEYYPIKGFTITSESTDERPNSLVFLTVKGSKNVETLEAPLSFSNSDEDFLIKKFFTGA